MLDIGQAIPISNVDVTFKVYNGTTLYGTVTISAGGIDWRPTRRWKRYTLKKRWAEFDELMRQPEATKP